MRSKVIRFSKTGNLNDISGVSMSDIFIIAMDLKLYNILDYIKKNVIDKDLDICITMYFREKLIENDSESFRYIFDNFYNSIDWSYLEETINYHGIYNDVEFRSPAFLFLRSIFNKNFLIMGSDSDPNSY